MFDLTSRKTLEECQHWKKDVESRIFLNGSESIPCVLVANKVNGRVPEEGGGGGGGSSHGNCFVILVVMVR